MNCNGERTRRFAKISRLSFLLHPTSPSDTGLRKSGSFRVTSPRGLARSIVTIFLICPGLIKHDDHQIGRKEGRLLNAVRNKDDGFPRLLPDF